MRRILALLALVAASCAQTPARADPIAADPHLLDACVLASSGAAALERCKGAVARPCIDVEGPSTSSEVLCWSAEADAWRAIIATTMQRLNISESYRDPARLASAQRAWEAWLEAECEYWAWEEGGGSGEQVERVQCAADLSADRAIALIGAERR